MGRVQTTQTMEWLSYFAATTSQKYGHRKFRTSSRELREYIFHITPTLVYRAGLRNRSVPIAIKENMTNSQSKHENRIWNPTILLFTMSLVHNSILSESDCGILQTKIDNSSCSIENKIHPKN